MDRLVNSNRNLTQAPMMTFDRKQYDDQTLLKLYEALLIPRLIEEKMLILLRQGKISKWFSGWGQEAISIGSVLAIAPDSTSCPCIETSEYSQVEGFH